MPNLAGVRDLYSIGDCERRAMDIFESARVGTVPHHRKRGLGPLS